MEKDTRNRIQRATQAARRLLEEELGEQLGGIYDIRLDGAVAAEPGAHLREDPEALRVRAKLVTAAQHHRDQGGAEGLPPREAVAALLRECAFTTLNRFVALKMLEARGIVLECVSKGPQSSGFREFVGLAPGLTALPDQGYRLYLDSLFDEIGREVRALFDRRDPASLLWPRKPALDALLELLNDPELDAVWAEDETIGWVYQYFNGEDERKQMRAESQAPRNSRELAVRNQFFTPRYVVEFLTDNTLARTWVEMRRGDTRLAHDCRYLVKRKSEVFLAEGEEPPPAPDTETAGAGAGAAPDTVPIGDQTVHVPFRAKKDPRALKILDPACGSGHFLLYAFDVLLTIYEEARADPESPRSEATGRTLGDDYPTVADLRRALPGLVLRHNLHGVDIDPRAAQIAALALWMRAQRAWNDFGTKRAERPLVTRTNVVVAEPMPGEPDLLDELCAGLDRGVASVVRAVFEDMKLAGEAGTLLRIEDTVRQGLEKLVTGGALFAVEDAARWESIEAQVYAALERYAETAGGAGYRKRLFAEDAARGFAFIDLCRQRYDVVLMNPPFGAHSETTKARLESAFPNTKRELAATFVDWATTIAARPDGRIGAITTKAPFFLKTYAGFREDALVSGSLIESMVDLARGVLDATVETCAFTINRAGARGAHFFAGFSGGMVLGDVDRRLRAAAAIDVRSDALPCYRPSPGAFASIPGSPIAYWVSPQLLDAIRRIPSLAASTDVEARTGASTKDDFRFLRLWSEVQPDRTARSREETCTGRRWAAFAKGGEYAPFFRDVELVIDWGDDGAIAKAFVSAYRVAHGWSEGWAAELSGSDRYFRPGVTWSRRTSTWLSPRALPAGCIFSEKAPTIFHRTDDRRALVGCMAWLSSSVVGEVIALSVGKQGATGTAGSNSYETGIVANVPFPVSLGDTVLDATSSAWSTRWSSSLPDETSHFFVSTALAGESRVEAARRQQRQIDAALGTAFGIDEETIRAFEPTSRLAALDPETPYETRLERWAPKPDAVVSVAVGIAFGRFSDSALSTGERQPPPEPDPFDPLPACSPGMLTGDDGLPVAAPPAGYPVDFPTDGILVDDPGAERDLLARVRQVFSVVFGAEGDDRLREATEILDPRADDLRPWLRAKFFEEHVKRYSKSRRKAPIYWQLGTPSGSYSVWLYLHRMGPDTLHAALRDHVAPKLRFETNRLATLRSEAGETPAPSQQRAIDVQEGFVDELRAFRDELQRVAPLWNPDLDDGVVINASFLHRLFLHTRSWAKELEKHWTKLQAGDYDWAHLALRLWPERVVPKCADDRSLAIAHGLEDTLWVEDADGKWQPRAVDEATIARLVAERTSAAVKDALVQVARAPAPPTSARGGRRAKAPARRKKSAAPPAVDTQLPLDLAAREGDEA